MNHDFTIEEPSPGRLIIVTSRSEALIVAGVLFMFLVFIYSLMLGTYDSGNLIDRIRQAATGGLTGLLFLFFPLLFLFKIIPSILVVVRGERHIVDGAAQTIVKNNRTIASFQEIRALRVQRIVYSESEDEFNVSLVLHDEREVTIMQTTCQKDIDDLAERISRIVDVPVIN
jgi:hypothetical protein